MAVSVMKMRKVVLSSGVVLIHRGDENVDALFEPIRIPIKVADDFEFSVYFNLIEYGSKSEVNVSTNPDDTVEINCYNTGSLNGTGNKRPIRLGVNENKVIYINFWIEIVGDGQLAKITYTVFQNGEV